MDLVEAESEEDLHRDPTISSPILDTLWCTATLLLIQGFLLSHQAAFKEQQRHITTHER
jgi:hypothetical protein